MKKNSDQIISICKIKDKSVCFIHVTECNFHLFLVSFSLYQRGQALQFFSLLHHTHTNMFRHMFSLFFYTDDKRAFVEPPMPGYQGYIPRIRPTELGLGCRYHTATKNGLEAFSSETMRHLAKEKTFAGFQTSR